LIEITSKDGFEFGVVCEKRGSAANANAANAVMHGASFPGLCIYAPPVIDTITWSSGSKLPCPRHHILLNLAVRPGKGGISFFDLLTVPLFLPFFKEVITPTGGA
jgi:hypothetical protein